MDTQQFLTFDTPGVLERYNIVRGRQQCPLCGASKTKKNAFVYDNVGIKCYRPSCLRLSKTPRDLIQRAEQILGRDSSTDAVNKIIDDIATGVSSFENTLNFSWSVSYRYPALPPLERVRDLHITDPKQCGWYKDAFMFNGDTTAYPPKKEGERPIGPAHRWQYGSVKEFTEWRSPRFDTMSYMLIPGKNATGVGHKEADLTRECTFLDIDKAPPDSTVESVLEYVLKLIKQPAVPYIAGRSWRKGFFIGLKLPPNVDKKELFAWRKRVSDAAAIAKDGYEVDEGAVDMLRMVRPDTVIYSTYGQALVLNPTDDAPVAETAQDVIRDIVREFAINEEGDSDIFVTEMNYIPVVSWDGKDRETSFAPLLSRISNEAAIRLASPKSTRPAMPPSKSLIRMEIDAFAHNYVRSPLRDMVSHYTKEGRELRQNGAVPRVFNADDDGVSPIARILARDQNWTDSDMKFFSEMLRVDKLLQIARWSCNRPIHGDTLNIYRGDTGTGKSKMCGVLARGGLRDWQLFRSYRVLDTIHLNDDELRRKANVGVIEHPEVDEVLYSKDPDKSRVMEDAVKSRIESPSLTGRAHYSDLGDTILRRVHYVGTSNHIKDPERFIKTYGRRLLISPWISTDLAYREVKGMWEDGMRELCMEVADYFENHPHNQEDDDASEAPWILDSEFHLYVPNRAEFTEQLNRVVELLSSDTAQELFRRQEPVYLNEEIRAAFSVDKSEFQILLPVVKSELEKIGYEYCDSKNQLRKKYNGKSRKACGFKKARDVPIQVVVKEAPVQVSDDGTKRLYAAPRPTPSESVAASDDDTPKVYAPTRKHGARTRRPRPTG